MPVYPFMASKQASVNIELTDRVKLYSVVLNIYPCLIAPSIRIPRMLNRWKELMKSALRTCSCRSPEPIIGARCSGHPLWRVRKADDRSRQRTPSTKHPSMQEQRQQKHSASCSFDQGCGRRQKTSQASERRLLQVSSQGKPACKNGHPGEPSGGHSILRKAVNEAVGHSEGPTAVFRRTSRPRR